MTQLRVGACDQCLDAWVWLVSYKDGELLTECPAGEAKHNTAKRHWAFADVDVARVAWMALIPQRPGLPQLAVTMTEESMRPIFFRRRYVELQPGDTDRVIGRQTIHCLGWQKDGPDGATVASYTFAFDEDGSVLTSADRNAV